MSGTVQVRIAAGKGEPELVDGPDDADVIVRLGQADTGLDPSVAFMTGKLKAEGHTGVLFASLSSGAIAASIARLTAG
ncbi:MAG: hypothetical protein AB7Q27_06225 [Acidimicrobiia bacterium]